MHILTGVACAALMVVAVPAHSADGPELPSAPAFDPATGEAVSAFYAARGGAPLWLRNGADGAAARELIDVLGRASIDGFANGPALAVQAQALLARASAGDAAAVANADRLLSTAWVQYVETLQTPPAGITYAD